MYHRTAALIDLDAMAYNIDRIREKIGGETKLLGVIKADAYGHGAVSIGKYFEKDFDFYGVACIEEALELKKAGIEIPILILGYVSPYVYEDIVKYDIRIPVFTLETAKALSEEACRQNKTVKFHFAVDTGMSRIGMQVSDESADMCREICNMKNIEAREAIARVNEEANLNIQLVLDEPRAFTGFKARLVNFTNVRNYLALVGPECKELDGILGYYGEQLVLLAQSLGLNSCWVGGTFKVVNRAYNVDLGQKLAAVVALGYGATQGVPHRSKAPQEVAPGYDGAPEWFKRGVDAALLAPTALNQQKFSFSLDGEENDVPVVRASTKRGAFTQMDLGIAQCHFEIGAGNALYRWAE